MPGDSSNALRKCLEVLTLMKKCVESFSPAFSSQEYPSLPQEAEEKMSYNVWLPFRVKGIKRDTNSKAQTAFSSSFSMQS